ncbi:MAG: CinA family protein [Alphaproteobacteria bacterium]|nr:CinA family protein [Alphaproteobacteria bacterium]
MMFPSDLLAEASNVLDKARTAGVMTATAESCTGGLVSALMTEIPGSSDVVERSFVTYSNEAKVEMLGVDARLIDSHGAVSREVALAMAEGALLKSNADIAVSITGVAGPGGTPRKPAGLVYFGLAVRERELIVRVKRFGDQGRQNVRLLSLQTALGLLNEGVDLFA